MFPSTSLLTCGVRRRGTCTPICGTAGSGSALDRAFILADFSRAGTDGADGVGAADGSATTCLSTRDFSTGTDSAEAALGAAALQDGVPGRTTRVIGWAFPARIR